MLVSDWMRWLAIPLLVACGGAATSAPPKPAEDPPERSWPTGKPIGAKAPPFRAKNEAGGAPLTLVPGKVNVIVFWATWSSPDLRLLRDLEPVWKRYESRGLVISALSVDEGEKSVFQVAREQHTTFPIGWDERHAIADRYQPETDPCLFVVDRSGVVRFYDRGYHDGDATVIAGQIESLL